jgi:tetratricopeptide (TPR) repeat protein
VAAWLRERPAAAREAVVAALDEWIVLVEHFRPRIDEPHLDWLRAVQAAAEPGEWGRQVRAAASGPEPRAALVKLAGTIDVERWPRWALQMLVQRLKAHNARAAVVALLRRAQVRHAGVFWINNDLGVLLLHQKPGGTAEALRYLQAAVALRPDSTLARINLSYAARALGRPDQALAEIRMVLDLDPKLAKGHTNLGILLYELGKRTEAAAALRKALALDPGDCKALATFARVLHESGQKNEAVAALRKAVGVEPANAGNWYALGNMLRDQGKTSEAVAAFEQAIRHQSNYPEALVNLGNLLQRQQDHDRAIALYRQALTCDPTFANAHFNLGYALLVQGKPDDALAAFRKAVAHDPSHAKARGNLARLLLVRGQHAEALVEYRKVVGLLSKGGSAPDLALAHAGLGDVHDAAGRSSEAVAEYRKAAALDPRTPWITRKLAQALLGQGLLAEARDSARRWQELLPAQAPGRAAAGRLVNWCDRLLALEPRLPNLVAGKLEPEATDRLPFAYLCRSHKHYSLAARLFADTFAASAVPAANLQAQHRYVAACCAARAGSGQGENAGRLDDEQRSRWRRQALTWLKADLTAYSNLLEGGQGGARVLVRQRLASWQQDQALRGIRDQSAIENLPAAERQVCRTLWAEVERLLRQVSPAPGRGGV